MNLWNNHCRIPRWICWLAVIFWGSLLVLFGQHFFSYQPSAVKTTKPLAVEHPNEPIQAIPPEIALVDGNFPELNPAKVTLGERLFQDVRLSTNNQKSCLSCHSFKLGGADRLAHSIGINGIATAVNTPTVFNVRFNFRFNWDGRYANLADHLDALMTNPQVMGTNWLATIRSLQQVPVYVQMFNQIYPNGVTASNIKDALVVYELSLNTPNARFDRFLQGDKQALNKSEQEGYRLFKTSGCVSCHQGVNLGGNMFQPFGVIGNYLTDRGQITKADFGRFNATKNEADRYLFRVPSLRNVAVTPPYFHDGSAQTLKESITKMTKYQLGRSLPTEQIELIAKFLGTLTGEYRGKSL
jgi:cytochrome c peroxidase